MLKTIKTSELSGSALDWAVAKCEGTQGYYVQPNDKRGTTKWMVLPQTRRYSTDWAQGGPIIEREFLLLRGIRMEGHSMNGQWLAMYDGTNTGTMVHWVKREDFPRHYFTGPTPLIAAMRCYVASKLGDTVEVPEELI